MSAVLEKIPVVSLKSCAYNKKTKVVTMPSTVCGMPSQFFVRSHVTGKEIRFTVIGEYDKLFDQDQWDGMQQIYRPVGGVSSIDHLVIYAE